MGQARSGLLAGVCRAALLSGASPLIAGVLLAAGAHAQVTINTTQTTSQDLDTLCGGGCPATGSATITNTGNVSNNAGTAVTASARPWSVLNQGTLTSTNAATAALLLTGFAGTVVNAGSIGGLAANGFGVRLNAGGAVTNQATGNITGRSGIIIANGTATVTNAGTINATVEGVYGAGTGSLTVTNTGSINGNSVGVFTTQTNGNVTNAAGGRISGGTSSGVLLSGGGTVVNNGTIVSNGSSTTQAGVRIIGGSASFTNTGSVSGPNGFLTNQSNASVTNTGTIAGTNGPGLTFTAATSTATVTNGGAIAGSAGTAVSFGGGSNSLTLLPGYSFTGNVTGGTGNTLVLGGDAGSATLDLSQLGAGLQFQNFTTVQKTGAATWILTGTPAGTADWTITAGALKVGDVNTPSARLDGSVTVQGSGMLQGHGTITGNVSNAATVAPGGTIGTLTVSGNYTQASNGTLAIELSPSATSKLVVGGSAALAGTLALTPLAGTYVRGATYQILTAGGGVSGTFGTVTGATLGLLQTLAVRYSAGDVSLVVQQAPLTMLTTTGNQGQVGVALDTASLTATGMLATGTTALFALTTAAGVRDAIDRIGVAAETYGDLASVALRTGQAITGLVGNQVAMTRGGAPGIAFAGGAGAARIQLAARDDAVHYAQGPATRADPSGPWSAWLSGFGNFGTIRGDGNAHTLTYSTGGTAFGIDHRLDPRWLVGGFGAYGSSGTSTSGLPGSGTLDTVATGLYASWSDGRAYVDGTLGYAYNDERLRRAIAFPGFPAIGVRGGTDAHQVLSAVEAGWRYGIGDGVTVTPLAGFAATTLDQAAFTETGAGTLSLAVRGQTTSSVRSQLGARVEHALDLGEGQVLTSTMRLAWAHELADTNSTTSANFVGAANARFAVQGAGRGRDSALVGAGTALKLDATSSLYVRYDGDLNGADNVHAVTGGVRLTW